MMNLIYTYGKTAHDKRRICCEEAEGMLKRGSWRPNLLASCAQWLNNDTGEFILVQAKETADKLAEQEETAQKCIEIRKSANWAKDPRNTSLMTAKEGCCPYCGRTLEHLEILEGVCSSDDCPRHEASE